LIKQLSYVLDYLGISVRFLVGGLLVFSLMSSLALKLAQPPTELLAGARSPEVKQQGLVLGLRMVELYLHSPCLHGVVLN
jgi:hypothetical protein